MTAPVDFALINERSRKMLEAVEDLTGQAAVCLFQAHQEQDYAFAMLRKEEQMVREACVVSGKVYAPDSVAVEMHQRLTSARSFTEQAFAALVGDDWRDELAELKADDTARGSNVVDFAVRRGSKRSTFNDLVVITVGRLTNKPGTWIIIDNCSLVHGERPTEAEARFYARVAAAELRAEGFTVVIEDEPAGMRADEDEPGGAA